MNVSVDSIETISIFNLNKTPDQFESGVLLWLGNQF